jgi:hypothetical protein
METYPGAAPLESPWRGANASLETITKAFIRLR